jgi:hypothetical protein
VAERLPALSFHQEASVDNMTKIRLAWKYRSQLWKYRKLIRRRRRVAALLAAGAGVAMAYYAYRSAPAIREKLTA